MRDQVVEDDLRAEAYVVSALLPYSSGDKMEALFFRPNAKLSSLFDDLPMEGILIDSTDGISETITDYHGNVLVAFGDAYESFDLDQLMLLKTLIMAFDDVGSYIDSVPANGSPEGLCAWLYRVLVEREWVLMTAGDGVSSSRRELHHIIKLDTPETSQ